MGNLQALISGSRQAYVVLKERSSTVTFFFHSRWSERFHSLINANRIVLDAAIRNISLMQEYDMTLHLWLTTETIVRQQCQKALGVYGIQPEK